MLTTIQPSGLVEQRERILGRLANVKSIYVPLQGSDADTTADNLGNTEYFPESNNIIGTIASAASLWVNPCYMTPGMSGNSANAVKHPRTGSFDTSFRDTYLDPNGLSVGERLVVVCGVIATGAPASGEAFLWSTSAQDALGGYGIVLDASSNLKVRWRESGSDANLCASTVSASNMKCVLFDLYRSEEAVTASLWFNGGLLASEVVNGVGLSSGLTGAMPTCHPGKGLAIGGRALTSSVDSTLANAAGGAVGNFLFLRTKNLSASDVAQIAMDHTLHIGELSPVLDKVL